MGSFPCFAPDFLAAGCSVPPWAVCERESPLVPGTGRLNVSQAASCPGNTWVGAVRVPQLDESAALPQL